MKRTTLSVLTLASLTLGLTACASDDETPAASGSAKPTVTIGVVGSQNDQWPIFVEKAAAAGITVELQDFTEYSEPNPALTQEQIDLNQFQHLQYLADYNVNAGEDLAPIGATAVYPLGLYSTKYESAEEIPDGSEIAVPNDPTNLSRSLLVLQAVGLIELRDGGNSFSTEVDVLPGSRVTVTPVAAAQTAIALDSVAASVINNDFIADAGLSPADALYQDDASSEIARPYINVWVARAEDKDNETYLELVELFHDAEVEAALVENSGGTAVIAEQSGAELEGYLADIQDNLRATQG